MFRESKCRLLVVAVISICLSSCTVGHPQKVFVQESTACTDITETALRSLEINSFSLSSAESWVKANFPNVENLRQDQTSSGAFVVGWRANNSAYSLEFVEKRLIEASKIDKDALPKLSDVIRCFGEPAEYEIGIQEGEMRQVRLSLWYPSLGIAYFGSQWCVHIVNGSEFKPDGNLGMDHLHIYGVGKDGADLLARSYERDGIQGYKEFDIVKNIKPWPGSINKIESVNCDG